MSDDWQVVEGALPPRNVETGDVFVCTEADHIAALDALARLREREAQLLQDVKDGVRDEVAYLDRAEAAEARVAELERVREAAYNFDARFEERFINGQAKPLNDALAALAHEEEK